MIHKRSKHESHGGMDLTTLKLFVQVCDTQSIKRVAEREGIDASSITKRLAK
jgi:DNA-binding transcriptional LysR family regulator